MMMEVEVEGKIMCGMHNVHDRSLTWCAIESIVYFFYSLMRVIEPRCKDDSSKSYSCWTQKILFMQVGDFTTGNIHHCCNNAKKESITWLSIWAEAYTESFHALFFSFLSLSFFYTFSLSIWQWTIRWMRLSSSSLMNSKSRSLVTYHLRND